MHICSISPVGFLNREVSSLTSTAASAIQKQECPNPQGITDHPLCVKWPSSQEGEKAGGRQLPVRAAGLGEE